MLKEIDTKLIEQAVAKLAVETNKILPEDLCKAISCAKCSECSALGKDILTDLENNIEAAKELDIPVCQDTGMAVVFADIGQDVHIVGDAFEDAVNKGVSLGYTDGLLRK